MATIVHGFDWPDRLVVGTVGQPGERTFYLQARSGDNIVSVALEKQQSAVLAQRMDEVLDSLMAEEGNPFSVPPVAMEALVDKDPLDQPVEEQFRTGAMSLGWDPTTAQIVIEALPIDETAEDAPDPFEVDPDEVLRVRIPVGTARAFVKRTLAVVDAGRPLCAICGEPMDGPDHICTLPDGFR